MAYGRYGFLHGPFCSYFGFSLYFCVALCLCGTVRSSAFAPVGEVVLTVTIVFAFRCAGLVISCQFEMSAVLMCMMVLSRSLVAELRRVGICLRLCLRWRS